MSAQKKDVVIKRCKTETVARTLVSALNKII